VEHLGVPPRCQGRRRLRRNYLLPEAGAAGHRRQQKRVGPERKIAEAREAEEREASQAIATRLSALELAFTRKVGDTEQLYGSVTNQDLADALKAKGFDVDRRKILLPDAIKALGEFTVPVRLHRDVTAQLKVTVSKE
jgi:large subunit ribosomal protein L9